MAQPPRSRLPSLALGEFFIALKLAFHDAGRHRHPREDRRENVGVSFSLPQE